MSRAQTWCTAPKEWMDRYYQYMCPVCGKDPKIKDRRRRYCSDKHQCMWNKRWITWSGIRDRFIKRHGRYCDDCGRTTNEIPFIERRKTMNDIFEVDHKIAIINGGHPYSNENLQLLCKKCHAKKTGKDMIERNQRNKSNKEKKQGQMNIQKYA